MKAVICSQYGSPSALSIQEVNDPTPNDNEVLVKVHATTVNRTDCALLRAKPWFMRLFTGILKPKQAILGTEFSGQIEAIGKNVTVFKIGDRVFGFNDMGLSSHAEYLTLKANGGICKLPEDISYVQGTACSEGAHYAYNFINKVQLQSKDRVLVNGATGAIGSALLQFLNTLDVHITAVGDTPNLEKLKLLGADQVIDYTCDDFTQLSKQSGQRYHFIFDTVGKSSFRKCKPCLTPNGVYISSELGSGLQNIFLAIFTPLWRGQKVIFPIPSDIPKSLAFVKHLIHKKQFLPVVEKTYPLHAIKDAYNYVETGKKTGNIVVTIQTDHSSEVLKA